MSVEHTLREYTTKREQLITQVQQTDAQIQSAQQSRQQAVLDIVRLEGAMEALQGVIKDQATVEEKAEIP